MKLFDVIGLHHPGITPKASKLHVATWNGGEDPLDVFLAGGFERWQSWQSKKNFERPYIVSLIKTGARDQWLLAGCYRRLGVSWTEQPAPAHWAYQTEEVEGTTPIAGRVMVTFPRPGRATYLDADNWAEHVLVTEVLARRISVGAFPGYHRFTLSKPTLDLIVRQEVQSWKGALQAVGGVYVITDLASGKLYVGSATGEGGIWSRWCAYSVTGHGGNRDLRAVLDDRGREYAANWQWSILEIADSHTSVDEVLLREAHWKQVLSSRVHGYNAN